MNQARKTMKKVAHSRVSRLLPFLILVGVALAALAGLSRRQLLDDQRADRRRDPSSGHRPRATRHVVRRDVRRRSLQVHRLRQHVGRRQHGADEPVRLRPGYRPRCSRNALRRDARGRGLQVHRLRRHLDSGQLGADDLSVFALAIDPAAPATLYAGTSHRRGLQVLRLRWYLGRSQHGTRATRTSRPLAIDPAAPTTLYAGTFGPQVFKSTNAGGTWAATGAGPNDYWGYGSAYALAINPATPATLYAGTDYGLFKSTDGGESWTDPRADVTSVALSLAVDPAGPATIYAGTSGGGVFKSTNAGDTWTPFNAGLGDSHVNALAIDPSNPSRIYAGTDNGVFEYRTVELALLPEDPPGGRLDARCERDVLPDFGAAPQSAEHADSGTDRVPPIGSRRKRRRPRAVLLARPEADAVDRRPAPGDGRFRTRERRH